MKEGFSSPIRENDSPIGGKTTFRNHVDWLPEAANFSSYEHIRFPRLGSIYQSKCKCFQLKLNWLSSAAASTHKSSGELSHYWSIAIQRFAGRSSTVPWKNVNRFWHVINFQNTSHGWQLGATNARRSIISSQRSTTLSLHYSLVIKGEEIWGSLDFLTRIPILFQFNCLQIVSVS